MTVVPWKHGKQNLWDVACVNALSAGLVGNPEVDAAEAEEK